VFVNFTYLHPFTWHIIILILTNLSRCFVSLKCREYLEREITVPQDRAEKVSRRLTEVLNKGLTRTREIFLLTDPAASVKSLLASFVCRSFMSATKVKTHLEKLPIIGGGRKEKTQ
ncbi:uncharacterized protein DC041_0000624, partial [Schistosoma bovis]